MRWRPAGSAWSTWARGRGWLWIADVGDRRGLPGACRADDDLVVYGERRRSSAGRRSRYDVGLAEAVLASNGDRCGRYRGDRTRLRQHRGVIACAVGHHELPMQRCRTRRFRPGSVPTAGTWHSDTWPTWSEGLVRRTDGMGAALSGGVDRGTAEGSDHGGDGHGGCCFSQPPTTRRGLRRSPYLGVGANLIGGHATILQAVHVSLLCVT
jgi:hypothetical protein